MTPEYFLIPIIMNQMKDLSFRTGIIIIDCFIILSILVLFFVVDLKPIKFYIRSRLQLFISTKTDNMIIITCDEKNKSLKYRALMYYISKIKNNKTIYCLKENVVYCNDYDTDIKNEKTSEYAIDQTNKFQLDDDIYGNIIIERKEKSNEYNRTIYMEYSQLHIYSKKKSLLELQEWIGVRVNDFNKYLRLKTSEDQMLITVSQSDDLYIEGVPWESTITFENSYFHNKDAIISKIDFFLNNKEWYVQRGIPYNLGILLYGEPGCGKTRFIKQLMNYTKRHAIDIKLNDNLDFNELKNIVYKDTIGDDYIVPQDKRIIIFEDIDSMGDVVKDRDLKKNDPTMIDTVTDLSELLNLDSDSGNRKQTKKKIDIKCGKKNSNNNLSYLLNIIDGINECCGRIIIMTTNKIDILDKALIRPGRIDLKIEFKKCSTLDIFMILSMYWKDMMPSDLTIDQINTSINYIYTSAEIINICRSTCIFDDIKYKFFI